MPLAYSIFGSYILFKEVLHDELGRLYRAAEFDASGIQRTVFLRIFDSPQVPKQDLIGAFANANRIGEILQATNVTSKPRLSETDGAPALAHDYLPAQPLTRVFEKVHEEGFPVPVDNALLILEKLALALSAGLTVEVGGASLVHGFLHPGTIFVTNDGEGLVSGFGIADQLLGTLDHPEIKDAVFPYLAPEVLLTRTASNRADVYSMGSILYQLITGQPLPSSPEERGGVLDSAELAYDEQPIPEDIKSLLSRALAARPEDRFSSAADFKKELDKLLYGGTYSPTTFNLALFVDRLFRAEIETEEKERIAENEVDFTEYLAPAPQPEPEPVAPEPVPKTAPLATGRGKGMLIGIAAAAVVIIAAVAFFATRGGPTAPAIPPTPTAEEVAAQRAAQDERIKALAAQFAAEKSADLEMLEQELAEKMKASEKKIEELQNQLRKTERKASLSADEKKRRQDLQRQIAAEEEAKQLKEQEAAAERERMRLEAERQATARQAATATALAEQKAAEAAAQQPTAPPPTRVAEAAPVPTEPPAQEPAAQQPATQEPVAQEPAAQEPEITVTENMFLEPAQTDTLPVVIKDYQVTWPRAALNSRRKGMVIVQATVNAKGNAEDVKILRADEDGFGIPQAVIDAVKKYRFEPATKNGVKVKSHATVTKRYNFRGR